MKKLTLKKTGYTIKGISDLTDWYGQNACIEMKSFQVKNIKKKTLLDNINDNGFGVQSINGAICIIYENFEGYLKYHSTVFIGKISEYTDKIYHEQM